MIVQRQQIMRNQSGDGLLGDIYSGAKKAYNWVKQNRPLTKSSSFLLSNPISQGLIGLTPYSSQINQGLQAAQNVGQKYGIGKMKKKGRKAGNGRKKMKK